MSDTGRGDLEGAGVDKCKRCEFRRRGRHHGNGSAEKHLRTRNGEENMW